ncbi:MAG: MFS transporter [Holosporales bacterium]|jgi:OPA family glycerol-3-phosphate transporter-like MFS transporter|nr:MFS transporter [Holosporales bacterium]
MSTNNYSDSCNKLFKYWRFRTLYSIIIGYALFYLIRQNFSIAIPAICAELNITKSDIGTVMSTASILYGLGKCFFGFIGDRYSARYVMSIGLFLSAIMNIFVGFSSAVSAFAIFWALNHCFQSMGAPPCIKLLTHWYSPTEMGSKWALWNTSHQIGSALIVSIAPFILMHFGWRYVFFLPGVFVIIWAAILFNRLRDTPESLKLPPVEKITEFKPVAQSEKWETEQENKLTYKETLKMAVCNKMVWYVGFANLFVYICRMTFLNWGPALLMEAKGSSLPGAGFQMVAFDMASMLGGICAGYASDKIFKGRRGPVSALCMILICVLVTIIWLTPNDFPFISSICMLGIGFMISGPQILIGVAAADFASKKAASTANGLTGTLGYAGSAIAGFGNGFLADTYGWNSVFIAVITSAIAAALLLIITWNKKSKI